MARDEGGGAVSELLAVAIFLGAYALIATEKVHRVAAALGGAGLMLATGLTDAEAAFYSHRTGIDWDVIFLLLGMMVIVGIMRPTGVFEYLAIWAARRSRGEPYRFLVVICLITAVLSALLDNVTTVVLIAPVTLSVCGRLALPPVPYLIAVAMASNIGGTATLIGDPPNIIIGTRAGLSFNDFLVHLAPLVVPVMGVFLLLARVLFRHAFIRSPERAAEVLALDPRAEIRDAALLVKCLVVLTAVMAAFMLHTTLHLEPSVVALLGAGALMLASRVGADVATHEIEVPTLVFFIGLFVMVGALIEQGVIDRIGDAAIEATGGNEAVTVFGLLSTTAVFSALVDNIPYVTAVTPVVEGLAADAGVPHGEPHAMWWAFALGADLGCNATAIAAAANIIVIGIAAKHGHRISFWEFTRYGLVVAPATIAVCVPYLYLRYLM
jgi:Na+/H+ antiporter NhaD/arsenite permease-like protein